MTSRWSDGFHLPLTTLSLHTVIPKESPPKELALLAPESVDEAVGR